MLHQMKFRKRSIFNLHIANGIRRFIIAWNEAIRGNKLISIRIDVGKVTGLDWGRVLFADFLLVGIGACAHVHLNFLSIVYSFVDILMNLFGMLVYSRNWKSAIGLL